MLSLRLLVSAILIPVVVALLLADMWFGPVAPIFGLMIVLLGAIMASEMVTMFRGKYPHLSRADVIVVTCAVIGIGWAVQALPLVSREGQTNIVVTSGNKWALVLGAWFSPTNHGDIPRWFSSVVAAAGLSTILLVFVVMCWVVKMAIRVERGTIAIQDVVPNIAMKLFIVAYVGGLTALASQIRWLGRGDDGMVTLTTIVIATKVGDIGAYFTGRLLGRGHPLPILSPKKTEAGFIGAAFFGGIAATIWLVFTGMATVRDPMDKAVAYTCFFAAGLMLSLFGTIGDLVESLIKRNADVKDASTNLPGFGGVLDLLDSIIFTGGMAVAILSTAVFVSLLIS